MPVQTGEDSHRRLALSLAACKLGTLPKLVSSGSDAEADFSGCFPVRIRQVEGRGRGFFAARDIAPGETVFRAAPLAWAISEDWVKNTCWWCFAHDSRRPFAVKAAGSTAGESSSPATKPGHRARYKGTFCSSSCMQQAVRAHGGSQHWSAYLLLLDCIESEVHLHRTRSTRSDKRTHTPVPPGICELAAADADLATFNATAKPAQFADEPFIEAEFDPITVTDRQLEVWISTVWDIIVAHNLFAVDMPDSSQRELVRLIANELYLEHVANVDPQPSATLECAQHSLSRTRGVTSIDSASRAIAPLFALDSMRSNEIDYIRTRLQQQEAALSESASLLTPATLVPVRIPWKPTLSQIESSWWGTVFKSAASSYALLSRAWLQASKLHPIGSLVHSQFRKVYFREMANSFGLYDPPTRLSSLHLGAIDAHALNTQCEQEWVGFCIYPTAVYFNHSCSPNVAKVRLSREMQFISTSAVKQGDELFISYGCITDPVAERRSRLNEHFFFTCACERCVVESSALA